MTMVRSYDSSFLSQSLIRSLGAYGSDDNVEFDYGDNDDFNYDDVDDGSDQMSAEETGDGKREDQDD